MLVGFSYTCAAYSKLQPSPDFISKAPLLTITLRVTKFVKPFINSVPHFFILIIYGFVSGVPPH